MSKRDVELVIRAKDEASKQAGRIATALDELDKIQKELADTSGKTGKELNTLADRLTKLDASGRASQAMDKINQSLRANEAVLNKLQAEYNDSRQSIAAYTKQIKAAETTLARLRKESDQDAASKKRLASQVSLVDRELKKLNTGLNKATRESDRLESEVKQTQVALRQFDGVVDQARTSLDTLTASERRAAEEAQLSTQIRRTQSTALDALINKHKAIAAATAAAAAREAQSSNIARVTQEGRTRALANFAQTASRAQASQDRLSASNQRAQSTAAGAATQQSRLGRSAIEAGEGAERSVRSWRRVVDQLRLIRSESRQSLGMMQRIRGQLLSIGAGYVGVFGAQRAVGSVIDAGMMQEAIEARFLVAFSGDQAKANEEMEFAKQISKDLALSYRALAPEYAKLAIAAKGTELEGEGVRKTFIGMSQAARANKMTSDELSRSFKALTQIISKGKFTAEEVRQQLGDQLPGAFNILADAIGVSATELDKMMEKGEVGVGAMVNFAEEMSRRAAPGLESSLESMSAALGRFDLALFEFQLQVAKSGFLDELTKGINQAAEALQDPAVQDGAVKLGKALGDLIVWFIKSAEHADKWVAALKILAYVMGLRFVAGFALDIVGLSFALTKGYKKLVEFGAKVGVTRGAVTALTRVLLPLAAFFTAWKLADWAYDNFVPFRRLSITTFAILMDLFDDLMIGWAKLSTFFGSALKAPIKTIAAQITGLAGGILGMLEKINGVLGNEQIAGWIGALKDYTINISNDLGEDWDKEFNKRKKEIEQAAAQRQSIIVDMLADTYRDPTQATANSGSPAAKRDLGAGGTVLSGATPFERSAASSEAKAAKEAENLAKRVSSKMESLRQRLAELISNDTNLTLEQRLDADIDAIQSKYKSVYADLKQLGKGRNSEEWRLVDALIAQETLLAKQKYEQEKIKQAIDARRAAEAQISVLQQTRRDLMQSAEFARENGDVTRFEQLKIKINEVTASLRAAIDAQIAYWQSVGSSPEAEAAIAALQAQRDALQDVRAAVVLTAQTAAQALGQTAKSGMDNFLSKIRETGDVIGSLRSSFLQFASDFLLKIAQMILQQAVLNALQGSSFGGTSIGQALIGAFSNHTGGMAGSGAPRAANPSWFSNATRYHNGGIAGLKPNEVPTILEKGEEVLTANDPRHMLNGGGAGGGAKGPTQFNQFIALDPEDLSKSIAQTSSFGQNIMTIIRAERRQVSTILNGG